MARLTTRIQRLETLNDARMSAEFAHLSEAELDARICQVGERLTTQLRDSGTSVADLVAELDRPITDRFAAALRIELAMPAFDAARFLAALRGQPASPTTDAPDVPQ